MDFDSLASAQLTLHGLWTISVFGTSQSTSTFTLDANALQDSDFFAAPTILYPLPCGNGVLPNALFSWAPPVSGPFPALVVNPWINYGLPGNSSSGPSIISTNIDMTSWDPGNDLLPGPARFAVAYFVLGSASLISPISVTSGSIQWENDPNYSPPGYPPMTPLLPLGGETRVIMSVGGCGQWQGIVNCDCEGGIAWTNPVSGAYADGANWQGGVAPTAFDSISFGVAPGPDQFAVSFASNAAVRSICVRNQKPIFDLGGFLFSVAESLTVGLNASARPKITNGNLVVPGTTVCSQGVLMGSGTLTGNLVNSGSVEPSEPPSLILNGEYYQSATGVLDIKLDTSQSSRLTVHGPATLGGILRVGLLPGADPPNNQQFIVLSATGTLTGTFGGALLPFLGPDKVVGYEVHNGDPSEFAGGEDHFGGGNGVVIVIGTPNGSPDFGDPNTIVLLGEPTGIAEPDVNPLVQARDLALSMKSDNPEEPGNAVILLNLGDGTFDVPIIEQVGVGPAAIVNAALADDPAQDDFAVPNRGDANVSVLFHDGGGSFTVVNVPVGDQPSAIAAGLLNGDGLVDLAVTNAGSHTVTLLFNNGDRTFTPGTPIPVGNTPSAIAIAEIDGVIAPSGGPDIVIANAMGNSMMFIRNFGPGGFGGPIAHPTGGSSPSSVNPADLDNDKDVDIMLGCSGGSGSVTLFINPGNGDFGPAVNLPVDGTPAQSPGALTHWDMDGDGDNDAVVVVNDDDLQEPVIRILRNDTSGGQVAFTLFNPIGAGEQPRLVAGADVTGDAADDLIAVNVQQLPLAGPPSSSLAIRPNLIAPVQPGDINEDGVVNIIDLLGVIAAWGPCAGCAADVYPNPSGDGAVNIQDLLFVIANWG